MRCHESALAKLLVSFVNMGGAFLHTPHYVFCLTKKKKKGIFFARQQLLHRNDVHAGVPGYWVATHPSWMANAPSIRAAEAPRHTAHRASRTDCGVGVLPIFLVFYGGGRRYGEIYACVAIAQLLAVMQRVLRHPHRTPHSPQTPRPSRFALVPTGRRAQRLKGKPSLFKTVAFLTITVALRQTFFVSKIVWCSKELCIMWRARTKGLRWQRT